MIGNPTIIIGTHPSIIFMQGSQSQSQSQSQQQPLTLNSSGQRTGDFAQPSSPERPSKFTYSQMKTNHKLDRDEFQETPYKGTSSSFRPNEAKEQQERRTSSRERTDNRRSSSTDRKTNNADPQLDRIEDQIKETGDRLRQIHLDTLGKEPGNLEDERRQLRKRLIDLDYDHKMLCAKSHIYGKDSPSKIGTYSRYSTYSLSSSLRLAEIETDLALIRSRRLRDLESDILLFDYYLDVPTYSYSWYRPYRFLDSYYPSSYSSYLYSPSRYSSYRSLWWL